MQRRLLAPRTAMAEGWENDRDLRRVELPHRLSVIAAVEHAVVGRLTDALVGGVEHGSPPQLLTQRLALLTALIERVDSAAARGLLCGQSGARALQAVAQLENGIFG